jgi:hypothetical protein
MESIYQLPSKSCDNVEHRNFWLKVIADQKASSLGTKIFCEQHQINFSTFTYWKYKKNKSYSSLNNNISEAKNKQLGKDVPKFIPLQIAADIPSTESHQEGTVDTQNRKIEIIFNNGHKIILPLVISDTNLLLLIRAVGGL